MKWLLRVGGVLVTIIGALALIGLSLPVGHEASRSAEFNRPPEAVFALISDIDRYGSWWPGGTAVKVAAVENLPPTKLVTRIIDETAFGGTWTMDIAPTAAGSRLTITERGEIYNVIFRALAKYVFGYTATIEDCLEAIARKLAVASSPVGS